MSASKLVSARRSSSLAAASGTSTSGASSVRSDESASADQAPGTSRSGPLSPAVRSADGGPSAAVVAATLSNPRMTGWLLAKLVSNREAAITPERIAMLQRPFVLDGWTHGLGEWLAPFATTRTSSMATDRSRYATLTMPTLVLWGARDSLTPMPQGEDLVRLIRGARWEVLPRAGHIPAIEDEPSFDAALLDFLRATAANAR